MSLAMLVRRLKLTLLAVHATMQSRNSFRVSMPA
jgi:hypothetical protein